MKRNKNKVMVKDNMGKKYNLNEVTMFFVSVIFVIGTILILSIANRLPAKSVFLLSLMGLILGIVLGYGIIKVFRDKEKNIPTIAIYGIIFFIMAIIPYFIYSRRGFLPSLIFGMVIGIMGLFLGYIMTRITQDKSKTFSQINISKLNAKEILFALLFTLLFWQFLKLLLGDGLIVNVLGLVIGWYLGRKIVKIFRNRKKK